MNMTVGGAFYASNVNETTRSYMDFIIDDEDSVLKYWLKAGASDWRLDVIDELPPQFSAFLQGTQGDRSGCGDW